MLSTSMADNVISYKKNQKKHSKKQKRSRMIQLSFSNALSCGVQRLPFSENFFHRAHKSFELTLRLSPIFQENGVFCVCSYLKHQCSHTGKFHTECFSVLYAFSCDCCIGLHHFLSHHITYTEMVCHCVSCTGAVPISPDWEIFSSKCCKHNPS